MSRALVVVAIVAAVALPGCTEPFRAHVPGHILRGAIVWTTTEKPLEDNGPFGPNTVHVEYTHAGTRAPYAGDLVVFSTRQFGGMTTPDLVREARDILADVSQGIALDAGKAKEGERELANGLRTHWIMLEGTVTGQGTIFRTDATVRLLAEVGFDGLSATAVIAIGRAQIGDRSCSPIISCTDATDWATWDALAGDPRGSIDGARSNAGMVHNLVTHG